MVIVGMTVIVPVAVAVVVAAQKPCAHDIHPEAHHRNRDRLCKVNRNRRQEASDGLVADEQRDHRKHDCTTKARQVAELTGTKHKPPIMGMSPRIGIRQCGDQHCAGVGRHMQAISDQR